jgi:tripartite-type tricarboxylate transporter receptor subunit TctC
MMQRRALLALALTAGATRAEARWPQPKPIRWTVAYPPGGVSDELSRVVADRLGAALGVPVLVEHRAGAGGVLAMEQLARAAPDGHRLCFSAISPLTLAPRLGHVGYDPQRDIAPVIALMLTPLLVVGTTALAASDFAGLLAQARARPGRLRWATSGLGTTGHVVLEEVRRASGTDIVHVPYKGGGQQLNDALGGQFEVLSSNVGAAQIAHVRAGRLKALAVGAPARLAVLPEVPTLAELGLDRANRSSIFGIFAPGRTPAALVERINESIAQVLAQLPVGERLRAVDNLPLGGSAAEFAQRIAAEARANRALFGLRPPAAPTR